MSGNNEAAPPHAGFTCFNVNCYTTFRTERGLRQHLWRSDACREYMSLPRPLVADSVNITRESTWRRRLGYGVESSRMNPFIMRADPPSYESYEVFDYSANVDADDDFMDETVEWDGSNCTVAMQDNVAISCPVFHAKMERIEAMERHAIMVLHHDVEHRNSIVNLLKNFGGCAMS